MTEQELALILASHKKWLSGDKEGRRANLRDAKLNYADLYCANLNDADLNDADLSGANLNYADLSQTDLSHADLSQTDLSHADLSHANLSGADLSFSNLRYADLSHANLRYAKLNYADLYCANLNGADLDFSCLPLWCGSLTAQFDDKQIIQIIYHAVKAGLNSSITSTEVKTELMKLVDLANKFHRANECGIINKERRNNDKETTES